VSPRLGLAAGPEADRAAFGLRGRHELPDCVEDHAELGVVLLLELIKLPSQLRVGCEELTEPYEGTYDLDVDRDRPRLRSTLESMATPCSVKA